jgi:hypothetical protein
MCILKRIFVIGIVAASVVASAARPARNAFLDYSVSSVSGLIHEVETDHAVADRFMRHFGMSGSELVAYFETLHVERLPDSEVFSIYSIPPDGHDKVHTERLPAGAVVFADPSGKPILLMKCGNPLTVPGPTVPVATPVSGPVGPLVPPSELPPVPENALTLTPPETPPLIPAPEIAPVAPLCAPAGAFTSVTNNYNYAAWGFLGAVVVVVGSGGHEHHHPTPPVPEPASLAFFGLGLCGMAAKRRAAMRRSRA